MIQNIYLLFSNVISQQMLLEHIYTYCRKTYRNYYTFTLLHFYTFTLLHFYTFTLLRFYKVEKRHYLPYYYCDKGFKGTVVNQALYYIWRKGHLNLRLQSRTRTRDQFTALSLVGVLVTWYKLNFRIFSYFSNVLYGWCHKCRANFQQEYKKVVG